MADYIPGEHGTTGVFPDVVPARNAGFIHTDFRPFRSEYEPRISRGITSYANGDSNYSILRKFRN